MIRKEQKMITKEQRTDIEDWIIGIVNEQYQEFSEADIESMVEVAFIQYFSKKSFLMQDLLNATKNIVEACDIEKGE